MTTPSRRRSRSKELAERAQPREQSGRRFGALARIERRRCPATADHDEQLAEPRLDRGLRALERVIRTVESHVHRAPDRRRIASDLAAGLVEVARRRDGLVEALDVRVPNVAVARGERSIRWPFAPIQI